MPEKLPARILIVDDDPLLAKSLCDTLQTEGYIAVTADGGQAGIDTFQAALEEKNLFDLVITDLGMNGVDGRQVIAAIKNISPSTPIILLTGWGQWFENKSGVPLPVNCILDKPLKLRELREALTQCLQTEKS